MTDLVFLDTETLGLDPDAPIWEFAAVRRITSGPEIDAIAVEGTVATIQREVNLFIQHEPTGWLDDFPEEFLADYLSRYDETQAWGERAAAREIHAITKGAHIVGAVPSFDTERLAKLLRRNGIEPEWYYHLIDVENVVVGYLHGVAARAIDEARMRGEEPDLALVNRRLDAPWKSDQLSAAVGVNPDDYARHTAMGDVRWAMAQWDAVTRNG